MQKVCIKDGVLTIAHLLAGARVSSIDDLYHMIAYPQIMLVHANCSGQVSAHVYTTFSKSQCDSSAFT